MKNLTLGIAALALTANAVSAQTTDNKWLIGVGAHGVNHAAIKGSFGPSIENLRPAFTLNNYTITPPLSKLTVARHLTKGLALDWQTSVGNVDNKRIGMDKEFFLMTGLGLQFKINALWNENSWFDPYLRVGANYLRHDYKGVADAVDMNGKNIGADHFAVNGGLGLNIWLTKNFGLGVQQDFVGTPTEKTTISDFWQTSATLNFRFGKAQPKDLDGDGVLDKDDNCPEVAGPVENNGCPWSDTDGDGVLDKDDNCPQVVGPAENNGCPWVDTDGDGVLDKDDHCPQVAGLAKFNGCPDTDGDGIVDHKDECPTVYGVAEYRGCPEPAEVIATKATGALKGITFDFGKSTISAVSNAKLDEAAKVIKSSNNGTFLVTGHTDKKGSAAINLKLSRERAAAVVKALEARGVESTQLKSTGVGSRDAQVPVTASNAEREADRKVVVEAINGAAWEALQKSDLNIVEKKKVVKKKAPVKKAPAKRK